MGFRFVLKSVILNDHHALHYIILMFFGIHHKNQWRKCSSGTLVSGNISFMWIFMGVCWRGASSESDVVENLFLLFSVAASSLMYCPLLAFH